MKETRKDIEALLAEYAEAGFNQRLNMYLQFPPLRTAFFLLEQSALDTELAPAPTCAGCGF